MPRPAPRRKAAEAGRLYRGVSAEQRRAERRQRLVAAGAEVIGAAGFHAATVRAVCVEAGLTERYFYESFEKREALLVAVYQHLIAQLSAQVVGAMERSARQPQAMIRAALTAYYRYLQRHPRAARVMLIEVYGVSPQMDRLYRSATRDFMALLRDVSRSLQPRALPPGVDEELLSGGLIGAVILIATQWLLSGCRKPRAAVVETSLAIFNAVNRQVFGEPLRHH